MLEQTGPGVREPGLGGVGMPRGHIAHIPGMDQMGKELAGILEVGDGEGPSLVLCDGGMGQ